MKAIVIYDSVYGNTAQIAQAIGKGLGDALGAPEEVQVLRMGEANPKQLVGLEVLVVGSPTHGFRSTPGMRDFLKGIPKNALNEVRVAAFDTRVTEEEMHSHGPVLGKMADLFGYAAPRISDSLAKKGGDVAMAPEGFFVGGTEGPLLEGELERAAEWGRQVLAGP
jgi:flavodoxin